MLDRKTKNKIEKRVKTVEKHTSVAYRTVHLCLLLLGILLTLGNCFCKLLAILYLEVQSRGSMPFSTAFCTRRVSLSSFAGGPQNDMTWESKNQAMINVPRCVPRLIPRPFYKDSLFQFEFRKCGPKRSAEYSR